ncbi:hypothetical protein F2P81_018035 [Scophthalmus maximus]|uniref:Uncharacterized protein n=1 Tax=Scophthalmus maximus TaxID=52904 RepID=A0A6A4SB61_SCOMX|nr:hypothetical protein F2P81_018035 [Scophthalmus maximus]
MTSVTLTVRVAFLPRPKRPPYHVRLLFSDVIHGHLKGEGPSLRTEEEVDQLLFIRPSTYTMKTYWPPPLAALAEPRRRVEEDEDGGRRSTSSFPLVSIDTQAVRFLHAADVCVCVCLLQSAWDDDVFDVQVCCPDSMFHDRFEPFTDIGPSSLFPPTIHRVTRSVCFHSREKILRRVCVCVSLPMRRPRCLVSLAFPKRPVTILNDSRCECDDCYAGGVVVLHGGDKREGRPANNVSLDEGKLASGLIEEFQNMNLSVSNCDAKYADVKIRQPKEENDRNGKYHVNFKRRIENNPFIIDKGFIHFDIMG